eukprot:2223290-Alexandrium_andersonii.AAC.1
MDDAGRVVGEPSLPGLPPAPGHVQLAPEMQFQPAPPRQHPALARSSVRPGRQCDERPHLRLGPLLRVEVRL